MGILIGIALNPYISLGNIDNFFEDLKNYLLFLLLFYFDFFAMLWGMWDLSSQTRIWTCAPCLGSAES